MYLLMKYTDEELLPWQYSDDPISFFEKFFGTHNLELIVIKLWENDHPYIADYFWLDSLLPKRDVIFIAIKMGKSELAEKYAGFREVKHIRKAIDMVARDYVRDYMIPFREGLELSDDDVREIIDDYIAELLRIDARERIEYHIERLTNELVLKYVNSRLDI